MKTKKRFLGILLGLVMALGLMPGMSLTAYAAAPPATEVLKPTVTEGKVTDAKLLEYAGKQRYVITSGSTGVQIDPDAVSKQTGETTIVLLAKENWKNSVQFRSSAPYNHVYGGSNLNTVINNLVTSQNVNNYYTDDNTWKNNLVVTRTLAGGASNADNYTSIDKISGNAVTDAILWPLSAAEVSQINSSTIVSGNWWLRSPGATSQQAATVSSNSIGSNGAGYSTHGARPALCLNLTSDIFASRNPDETGVYELTKTEPHTHSFTYSADGAKITATCGNTGCTLTAKPTLTIVKPTLETYGQTGKSAVATLTGLDAFNTATSLNVAETDIKYVGRDGTSYTESATAPTNAGKYTAKITLSGVKTSVGDNQSVTASVDYEIAKVATSVTTAPTAGEITYGQTLADSALTGGTASVAGTFAWKDSTVAPAVSDSQKTEYDVVFTPTDVNYSTAECKVKLTVNKAATPAATVARVARPSTEASPSKGAIDVSWKAASGAKSYQVQWRKAGASKWTTKTVRGRKYTITGLRRGAAYQVRVRGVAGSAKGDWSKASSRWLKAASKVRAATGKKAGTVRVSWARDAKANAGCRVYVYARQGGKAVKTIEVAKGKVTATVGGLTPGKKYFVRVRPYRRASGTTFSGAISGYRTVRAAK